MKQIICAFFAVSLLAVGCDSARDSVDETVETDRYVLTIQDPYTYRVATGNDYVKSYINLDTSVFIFTIPQLAYYLSSLMEGSSIDSTTVWYVDSDRQAILYKYAFTLVDHDTAQPDDYTPLLQAMIERNFLDADTTYEPMKLLVVYDSVRLANSIPEEVKEVDPDVINIASTVNRLRDDFRMPVTPDPKLDLWMFLKIDGWDRDDWQKDSLWLEKTGLRIVDDPQGRQMRIVEFNRCKGSL